MGNYTEIKETLQPLFCDLVEGIESPSFQFLSDHRGDDMAILKTFCSICNPQTHCGHQCPGGKWELVGVEGMPEHPPTRALCAPKGRQSSVRLCKEPAEVPHGPEGKKGRQGLERISWEEPSPSLPRDSRRFAVHHGPESVVFFAGYPKWYRPFLQRLHCLRLAQLLYGIEHL